MHTKKRPIYKIISLVLLAYLSISVLGASTLPSPTTNHYINDYVHVLDATTINQIQSLGLELESKTSAEAVVVLIDSTQGIPIEQYAINLFRSWGIGQKNIDNGLLILVALEDQTWRVEVGRGLEGALPDLLTNQVMDEYAKPYFIEGQYDTAILNAYSIFSDYIASEYQVTLTHSPQITPYISPNLNRSQSSIWIILTFLIIADMLFNRGRIFSSLLQILFWSNIGRGPRGGGGGYRGGSSGRFGGGSSNGGGSSGGW